ncbi:hypothetical protein V8G54_000587 [Vigna mungo]|uniref:Reverse transcriptase Ty1/copia-type domain-containing protein n=1 Tax=Vigna mungo TaxID=3915 RepID=A0AAQ3P8X0_VIGMU
MQLTPVKFLNMWHTDASKWHCFKCIVMNDSGAHGAALMCQSNPLSKTLLSFICGIEGAASEILRDIVRSSCCILGDLRNTSREIVVRDITGPHMRIRRGRRRKKNFHAFVMFEERERKRNKKMKYLSDFSYTLPTNKRSTTRTKLFLGSNFEMKDMSEANMILGIRIIRKGDSILLSQEQYIEKLLKKFGYYDFKPIIGSLLHLISFSRPDIASAVGRLSRLMRYLRGSMDYAIEYSGFPGILEGYNDVNWISDSNETKSTSGYVFILGAGAITWRSTRQTIIARSTMESEFVALEMTGNEVEWLKNFLANITLGMKPTPSLLKSGTISIDYVKSEWNVEDPLTKPLRRQMIFETSRGMNPISAHLLRESRSKASPAPSKALPAMASSWSFSFFSSHVREKLSCSFVNRLLFKLAADHRINSLAVTTAGKLCENPVGYTMELMKKLKGESFGAEQDTPVTNDSNLITISDKLRLVSKPKSEQRDSDLLKSDEELARLLQEALLLQQYMSRKNPREFDNRVRGRLSSAKLRPGAMVGDASYGEQRAPREGDERF